MRINTLKFLLKSTLKNIKRHSSTFISCTITVMLTLFILEMFVLATMNLRTGVVSVYTKYEVQATLKGNLSITEKKDIDRSINALTTPTNVTLLDDPFAANYIIRVSRPDDVAKMESQLSSIQGIDRITDDKAIPPTIISLSKVIILIGSVIFVLLITAIFFLIKRVLRLAIHTRIDEINIMQYLGATDWFIKLPVVFEAISIGFLGAAISVIAVYFSYVSLYDQIKIFLGKTFIEFILPAFICTTMSWSFILIGILITTISSMFIIRKYLVI
ncbi:FtsX-like permease family protein [Clostridium manihotivorum]|uniref:ABC3 transporter permease C-terminal domain-containing protein n=1 Tax=Clostridium manihotivorum TaxID=2320868 RepID=A0A3R5V964_9CLOT|nr:FtsX-like permease family protein [Clostridium manihotivorum]QAA33035.1 hypothetical protein C1I91_16090 [Clostridium manihotivorum]